MKLAKVIILLRQNAPVQKTRPAGTNFCWGEMQILEKYDVEILKVVVLLRQNARNFGDEKTTRLACANNNYY